MNGLITEGIPLGVPAQILTGGLSLGEAPSPPPAPTVSGGVLYLNVPALVVDNEDGLFESGIIALPATMTRLACQMTGTVTSETLELSNDGITFITHHLFTEPGIQFFRTGAKFARITVNDGTGVSVTLLARREKF